MSKSKGVPLGEKSSDVFGRANAITAIIALLTHGPMNLTKWNDAMVGYAGNAKILAQVFKDAGLVTVEEIPWVGKTMYRVALTPLGEKVAKLQQRSAEVLEGKDKS